jgi:CBS domain-containing protein
VISDRDILRFLVRIGDWNASYVRQFMVRDVVAVKPDTKLSLATGMMLSKRINCLPVVDEDGVVCGIITSTDLLKAFRSIQASLE